MSASKVTGILGKEPNTGIPGAIITRFDSSDHGTFGTFSYNDFVCYTIELPDRDNKSNVSCIPKGTYTCKWTDSARFKRKMYLVDNVPGRGGIRIHSGCLAGDKAKGLKAHFNGCIGLGLKLGFLDGQKAILLSKPAIRQFETLLGGRTFMLEIK